MKILVTSALPYANGPIHFGHLVGAYLPADCYVRAMRLMGHQVLFVSGSDEYGIAITMSAELAGRTPQEHVDHFYRVNKELFEKLDVKFDHFSRTTWQGHMQPVQQFFLDLLHNGFIEEKETEQLYSEKEKRFLADRYVTGTCPKCGYQQARGDECTSCGSSYEATDLLNPRSKLTGSPLILKKTNHWFLLLDKMKPQLMNWIQEKKWKPNVLNFALEYIKDLKPRSVTRDMEWGIPIPLPNTAGKVLYVWFDAPIGYISASMDYSLKCKDPQLWEQYWLDPAAKLVHFIGKDNIPFHAVIFPAMCLGQNMPLKLVDELAANEFFNLEGRQFSKSDGWTIDLEDFLKKFSTDQIRYALAANAPENSDSEFNFKDFQNRCNSELVGKLGNFVNRTLTFIHKNQLKPQMHHRDHNFLERLYDIVKEAKESYSTFRMRKSSQLLMELAQSGNIYFDQHQPWKLIKDATKSAELENVLYHCLECIKLLALVGYPIIPSSSQKIFDFLGFNPLKEHHWDEVIKTPLPIDNLQEPSLLFSKIEDALIEEEILKLNRNVTTKVESPFEPIKEAIAFDHINQVDLRVGTIVEAAAVPKSDKLLKLLVDIGLEKRQVIAGIGKSYSPENLIGKKIILVANLKSAKLMGIESQGMVLAGGNGQMLEIPFLQTLPNGSRVK